MGIVVVKPDEVDGIGRSISSIKAEKYLATWPEWKRRMCEGYLTNITGTRKTPRPFVNSCPENDGF